MFWSLFTAGDKFDLPFQHVTMSGSISRNLSFGPWWPLDALGISKNSCMAAEAIPSWKKNWLVASIAPRKTRQIDGQKTLRSQSSEGLNKHIFDTF
jgi:hypothetical protein